MKIEIDKKEIWKAKDELTKRKTYSTRMQFGFEEGIKFALKQVNKLPIHVVSKWVACKDELPKGIGTNLIKYPIIIFDKEEGVVGAFYYENEENSFQTDEGLEYYNVTHWAELPEQPCC